MALQQSSDIVWGRDWIPVATADKVRNFLKRVQLMLRAAPGAELAGIFQGHSRNEGETATQPISSHRDLEHAG
jgi:hypothetical protein